MPLQWRIQLWQSLEEGAGKRDSECGSSPLLHRSPPGFNPPERHNRTYVQNCNFDIVYLGLLMNLKASIPMTSRVMVVNVILKLLLLLLN